MHKLFCALITPRRSFYKLGQMLNVEVPPTLARILSVGNTVSFSNPLQIKTYDGSGQACHPTVTSFQGKLYMACTPYPYGEEFYENPCVYTWEVSRWQPVSGAFPVVRPRRLGFEHYSDPCLFQRDGQLELIFRKCERRESGGVDQLYITSSPDGTSWTAPRVLAEQEKNTLISPAIAENMLFCVEYNGFDSNLVWFPFENSNRLGIKTVCTVDGLDNAYLVWHIDCATLSDGTIRGLFMLREKKSPMTCKLALFTWFPGTNTWSWERDIPESEEERRAISFVYKSCFTEDLGRALCSARDRKGRFFLYQKAI